MELILFLLFFILPFIVLPFGLSPFETPKVSIAEVLLILILVTYGWTHSLKQLQRKAYVSFIVLGIVGLFHLFVSPSATVWFGNVFRMQGTFLWLLLLAFAVVSSQVMLPPIRKWMIMSLLLIQLLVAVLIEGKIDYRAIGTLGEPNSLAAFAIVLLPFLLYPTSNDKTKKYLQYVYVCGGVLVSSLIILFSGSRSGVIALFVILLFYVIQKYRLSLAIFISCVVIALSLVLPFLSQDQVYEDRATIWRTASAAIMQKPWLGWGVGNTEVGLVSGAHAIESVLRFEYVDHTHNIFLEILVQVGILGFCAFSIAVCTALYNLYKSKQNILLSILLGLLCIMSFNPVSVAILIPFWYLLGRGVLVQKR